MSGTLAPTLPFSFTHKYRLIHGVRLRFGPPPWSIIEIRRAYTMNLYFLLAAAVGGEIIDLVGETGPVAKVVFLILLIFSLISWAIILSKWSLLRRARVQSGRFVRAFRKAQRLQDVSAVADQFRPSPLVGVFEGGFEEYKRQLTGQAALLRSLAGVQRGMQIGASEEVTRLERNLP